MAKQRKKTQNTLVEKKLPLYQLLPSKKEVGN